MRHGLLVALLLFAPSLHGQQAPVVSMPAGPGGYNIMLAHAAFSPNNATTYFWGFHSQAAPVVTQGIERVGVPRSGTVTRIELTMLIVTTNGTGESGTFVLQVDGVDAATLSTTKVYNGGISTRIEVSYTGLNVAVAAGQHLEFKDVEPTWVTKPVNVIQTAQVFVSTP